MSIFDQFLEECCEVSPGLWTSSQEFVGAFQHWSQENGYRYPLGPPRIKAPCETRGLNLAGRAASGAGGASCRALEGGRQGRSGRCFWKVSLWRNVKRKPRKVSTVAKVSTVLTSPDGQAEGRSVVEYGNRSRSPHADRPRSTSAPPPRR